MLTHSSKHELEWAVTRVLQERNPLPAKVSLGGLTLRSLAGRRGVNRLALFGPGTPGAVFTYRDAGDEIRDVELQPEHGLQDNQADLLMAQLAS